MPITKLIAAAIAGRKSPKWSLLKELTTVLAKDELSTLLLQILSLTTLTALFAVDSLMASLTAVIMSNVLIVSMNQLWCRDAVNKLQRSVNDKCSSTKTRTQ